MRMHRSSALRSPNNNACKGLNLFLSHPAPKHSSHSAHGYTRHFKRSYRGPIYSLSTPSPASPTVYAGISNGLSRLDFLSTDDLTGPSSWYKQNICLDLDKCTTPSREADYGIVGLSGYERPESPSTSVLSPLRDQKSFSSLSYTDTDGLSSGWDRRWEKVQRSS